MITWMCKHESITDGCEYCMKVAKGLERLGNTKPSAAIKASEAVNIQPACVHRLDRMGDVLCSCPSKNRMIESYGCKVKGQCTVSAVYIARDHTRVQACRLCDGRQDPADVGRPMTWSYGVTTVLPRKTTTLPRTLTSLAAAGFDDPRLFVDGGTQADWQGCKYPLTVRDKINAYANWWLAAQELYVRSPNADRYLIVQDDVVFVRGLRTYLEKTPWPGRGYLNLYTHPENAESGKTKRGFFRANQKGLGALALVFDKESIKAVLAAEHMVEKFRPKSKEPWRATKAIDGGVVETIRKSGGSEWTHFPSLAQHINEPSTLGHGGIVSPCFPEEGEKFDARMLLS